MCFFHVMAPPPNRKKKEKQGRAPVFNSNSVLLYRITGLVKSRRLALFYLRDFRSHQVRMKNGIDARWSAVFDMCCSNLRIFFRQKVSTHTVCYFLCARILLADLLAKLMD